MIRAKGPKVFWHCQNTSRSEQSSAGQNHLQAIHPALLGLICEAN